MLTQDIGFRALAEDWQRQGRPSAGLFFSHPHRGSIGQHVDDLEAVAKASEQDEWLDLIESVPFP